MIQTIRVRLNQTLDRSYAIRVRSGILKELPAIVAREWEDRTIFIITDSNVQRLYGRRFLEKLNARGVDAILIDFPAGEQSKNSDTVKALHTQLLTNGIKRDSLIIALGGGVVGDVAGYVAATILRGIKYIQVPTTLLGQVDSSIGGKVGIDHPYGKNMIGAFHQPSAVYIDPNVLRTLSTTEFRLGLAEVVKIAAASDKKFFAQIERVTSNVTKTNVRLLSKLITQSVGLKAAIIEKDEFESGLRKTLNLGHTIGHAVEAATECMVPHGAAVSIGLVAESLISMKMGLLDQRGYTRLLNVLKRLKLPTTFPRIKNASKFLDALYADKKSDGVAAKFVLLKRIGHSVVGVDVPTPFIKELLGKSR